MIQSNTHELHENDLNLFDLYTWLINHWRSIILIYIILSIISASIVLTLPRYFVAHTKLMVSELDPKIAATLIDNDTVKNELIHQFQLMAFFNTPSLHQTRELLNKQLKISLAKEGWIAIEVSLSQAELAANIANTLTQYMINQLKLRGISTYTKQNQLFKQKLTQVESNIKNLEHTIQPSQFPLVLQSMQQAIAEMRADLALQMIVDNSGAKADVLRMQEQLIQLQRMVIQNNNTLEKILQQTDATQLAQLQNL
jgi:hypothetical protein